VTASHPRADALANRRAILDAAREVLAEDATSGSIEQIARRAGVARRTVYGHFPTREDLVRALATTLAEEVTEQLAAVPVSDDALVALAGFVHATSTAAAVYHPLGPLSRLPAAREELSRSLQQVRHRLADLLAAAAPRLDLAATTPAAAAHLITAMQWGLLDAVAQGELPQQDAATVATRSVLRALGVPADEVEALVTPR
jgi:AcrR family transcriptional regulator